MLDELRRAYMHAWLQTTCILACLITYDVFIWQNNRLWPCIPPYRHSCLHLWLLAYQRACMSYCLPGSLFACPILTAAYLPLYIDCIDSTYTVFLNTYIVTPVPCPLVHAYHWQFNDISIIGDWHTTKQWVPRYPSMNKQSLMKKKKN